uniref:Transmembrane protein 248-like n=1 Tax=Phallusia mammillata TaxID=59560 RepID=A0A6F9DVN9_9ASCI|nr:transmembrane protein 248-like [Phallusia mammillata]
MAVSVLYNVRSFLSSRPPLVVFIFCLGMMAIAFVSFAYYIKLNNIRNPDIQKDWNTFMENITKIDFCLSNDTISDADLNRTIDVMQGIHVKNVSLHLSISVLLHVPMNGNVTFSSFTTIVNGSQLGLSGPLKNQSIQISAMPIQPYSPYCDEEQGCLWTMPACLTITGPQEIFPFTPRPVSCKFKSNTTDKAYKDGRLVSSVPGKATTSQCPSLLMKIIHEEDEQLFVVLTVETRSRVQVRLLHSSYFLFVVIITVILFGIIRGGRHHHIESPAHSNRRSRSPLLSRQGSP